MGAGTGERRKKARTERSRESGEEEGEGEVVGPHHDLARAGENEEEGLGFGPGLDNEVAWARTTASAPGMHR